MTTKTNTQNVKSGELEETGSELMIPPSAACNGIVKVHESVLASIVRKATCSVDGVVRLAGSSFVDNIAEIVGSKKIYDRSISIDMGESSVQIEVKIVVAYGKHIPSVAMNVQSEIISEITKITGMTVSKVNVAVMDIDELPHSDNAE